MYLCLISVLGCALWQADSGFFCEGYSSDEDVLVKEEFRGNIIKQGCLLKQVSQAMVLNAFKMFVCRPSAKHLRNINSSHIHRHVGKNNTAILWSKVRNCFVITIRQVTCHIYCVILSQGHRRKNWKVRKFILRDDPAYMHYYDPSKVNILTCTS